HARGTAACGTSTRAMHAALPICLAVAPVDVDAIEPPRTRAVPHRDVAQTQGHDGELRTSFGLSRSCSPASSPEVMWTLAIRPPSDRKSTRLNSSHVKNTSAGFCL